MSWAEIKPEQEIGKEFFMGQAKKRGSFEQRREQAIAGKEQEYLESMSKSNKEQLDRGPAPAMPKPKRVIGGSVLIAALALALHGK